MTPAPTHPHPGWFESPSGAARTALLLVLLAVCSCSPTGSGTASGPAAADPSISTVPMQVTFYAALDNDPPGSTKIAYPILHPTAAGTGTATDPITFATDQRELPPGTRIYHPELRKYFLMEDDCAECDTDWTTHHRAHIDLWAGPATTTTVLTCENQLTTEGRTGIEINPPPTRPVDTTPLFNEQTTTCHTGPSG